MLLGRAACRSALQEEGQQPPCVCGEYSVVERRLLLIAHCLLPIAYCPSPIVAIAYHHRLLSIAYICLLLPIAHRCQADELVSGVLCCLGESDGSGHFLLMYYQPRQTIQRHKKTIPRRHNIKQSHEILDKTHKC